MEGLINKVVSVCYKKENPQSAGSCGRKLFLKGYADFLIDNIHIAIAIPPATRKTVVSYLKSFIS